MVFYGCSGLVLQKRQRILKFFVRFCLLAVLFCLLGFLVVVGRG